MALDWMLELRFFSVCYMANYIYREKNKMLALKLKTTRSGMVGFIILKSIGQEEIEIFRGKVHLSNHS